ncbi:MAG: hypothetical protein AB7T49_17040 [Oligoflexales bacterium]
MRTCHFTWLALLTIITNACFEGPGFFQQSGDAAGIEKLNVSSEGNEVYSGTVSNSSVTQVIEIGDGSDIAGSSVTVPPGALAVGTELLVQPASDIANNGLSVDLDLEDGVDIAGAGTAVAVTTTNNVAAASAFTISLPVMSESGLYLFGLLEDDYDLLVVVYKVMVPGTNEYITGIIPRSEFQIVDGKAVFETTKFGVFQLAYSSQKIEKRKEADAASGFVTRTEEKALPPISWDLSVELQTDRTAKFGFKVSGLDEIERCTVTVDRDKVAPWDMNASIGQETFYRAEPLASTTHVVYARFACRDKKGRESGYSQWKDFKFDQLLVLKAPKVSSSEITNDPRPQWTWSGSSSSVVFRYRLGNDGTFTETAATSFKPSANLAAGSYILYVQEGDGNGRWSENGSFTVQIDLTPPPAPTYSHLTPSSPSTSTTVTVVGVTDSTNQIYRVYLYKDNDCLQLLASGSQSVYAQAGIVFTAASNSPTSIYAKASDRAGNYSACTHLTSFVHDDQGPTVNAGPDRALSAPGVLSGSASSGTSLLWTYTGPGTCTFDNASPTPNVSCDAQGPYTFKLTATDAAGNAADDSATVVWDTTAPTLTVPANFSVPWPSNSVMLSGVTPSEPGTTLSWSSSSSFANLSAASGFNPVATFMKQGTYSFTVIGTDLAGNASAPYSITVTVTDNNPPPGLLNFRAKSGPSVGTVALYFDFPANTDDYDTMTVRYDTAGTPANCTSGTPLSITNYFGGFGGPNKRVVLKDLSPSTSYYFIICVADVFSTFTSTPSSGQVFPAMHRIFVTSESYFGNLNAGYGMHGGTFSSGLLGADHRCQALANSAQLKGYWRAVLSDPYTSANTPDRLTFVAPQVWNAKNIANTAVGFDSDVVATSYTTLWSADTTNLLFPLDHDETGFDVGTAGVWTGTTTAGAFDGANHCGKWTDGSHSYYGQMGAISMSDDKWVSDSPDFCDIQRRLYCIDQTIPTPDDFDAVPGSSGKINIVVDVHSDTFRLSHLKLFHATGGTVPSCSGTPVKEWFSPYPTTPDTWEHPVSPSINNNYRLCFYDGGTPVTSYTVTGVVAPL